MEGSVSQVRGHVHARRVHKAVTFVDLVAFGSGEAVKLVAKGLQAGLLADAPLGSYLRASCAPEPGSPNLIVLEVLELRANLLQETPRDTEGSPVLSKELRYLYMRTPRMREVLLLRSRALSFLRGFLTERGHVEVQTPILTAPAEEGARCFLVPSRLHKGSYYALAQSPQIYKQLVIYGGLNYFQVAPSFRDEDGRSDRANGEFYQIDCERALDSSGAGGLAELAAFEIEMVMGLAASLEVPVVYYGAITYQSSMRSYGSDKPLPRYDGEGFTGPATVNFSVERLVREGELDFSSGGPLAYEGASEAVLWGKLEEVRAVRLLTVLGTPMFERRSDGRLAAFANPFADFAGAEPLEGSEGLQFDVVAEGYELSSGGVRNTDPERFVRVMEVLGRTRGETEASYGYLLRAFASGVPRHGGFGLGLERLLSVLLTRRLEARVTVEDLTPFPLNDRKVEPITGAPMPVDARFEA